MNSAFDPQLVVTRQDVLFSWIVADQLKRIRVLRDMIDRAHGRPFGDGEAWALVESRLSEIAAAHQTIDDQPHWLGLLGPRHTQADAPAR